MRLKHGFLVLACVLTGAGMVTASQDQVLLVGDGLSTLKIPSKISDTGCLPIVTGTTIEHSAIGAWKSGICRFHEAQRLGETADKRAARRQLWRDAIDDLNRAQTQGLTGNEHAFSSLVEGLTHCRQSQEVLTEVSGTFNPAAVTTAQYSTFCSNRRQALASFSDVNWSLLNVVYETTTQTLDQRFNEMNSCYTGVLSASYDAVCGLVTELPEETIDTIVEQETEAALYQAFDSAGAPVDALIGKKIERIRTVVEDAWKEMTGCTRSAINNASDPDHAACTNYPLAGSLEFNARTVGAQHTSLKAAVKSIEPDVQALLDSYNGTILSGYAALDEYNRWKNGLFDSNLKTTLTQRLGDLTGTTALFRQTDAQRHSTVGDAQTLASTLTRLTKKTQQRKQTIASLCQVVFCEFYEYNRMDEDTIPVCKETGMTNNPLCVNDNYDAFKSGTLTTALGTRTLTQKVVDLCQQAGFPATFATIGTDNPNGCFANYKLPE